MKMPANRMATSAIGSQLNSLASRCSFGVSTSERIAISTSAASRATFCSSSLVPYASTLVAGFHAAAARMAVMMPAMSSRLMLPLTPIFIGRLPSPTVAMRRSLR